MDGAQLAAEAEGGLTSKTAILGRISTIIVERTAVAKQATLADGTGFAPAMPIRREWEIGSQRLHGRRGSRGSRRVLRGFRETDIECFDTARTARLICPVVIPRRIVVGDPHVLHVHGERHLGEVGISTCPPPGAVIHRRIATVPHPELNLGWGLRILVSGGVSVLSKERPHDGAVDQPLKPRRRPVDRVRVKLLLRVL